MIKKHLRKMVLIILAAVMIFSLAGCSADATDITYKVEDVEIPVSTYNLILLNAYNAVLDELYKAELAKDTSQNETLLYYKIENEFFKMKIDDKSTSDVVLERALSIIKDYVVVEKEFERLGLTIEDSNMETIDSYAEMYFGYNEDLYNYMGITKESFIYIQLNNYKYQYVFEEYFLSEDSENLVSDSEVIKHLEESYAKGVLYTVNMSEIFAFESNKSGDSVNLDIAQKALDDLDALAKNLTEGASFSEEIIAFERKYGYLDDVSVDSDTEDVELVDDLKYNISEYSHLLTKDDTTIAKSVVDAVWSETQLNKYQIIIDEEKAVYYLVARLKIEEEDAIEQKTSVVQDLKADEFKEILTELSSSYSVEASDLVLEKLTPKKFVKRFKKARSLFATKG